MDSDSASAPPNAQLDDAPAAAADGSFDDFDTSFKHFNLADKLKIYAQENFNISPMSEDEFNRSEPRIVRRLKSEIARQFWDEDGFYKIYNRNDKDVQSVIQGFE